MTKFHMKRDGTPGVCTAEEGNCPYGVNTPHIYTESIEEAQRFFDKKNEHIAKVESIARDFIEEYDIRPDAYDPWTDIHKSFGDKQVFSISTHGGHVWGIGIDIPTDELDDFRNKEQLMAEIKRQMENQLADAEGKDFDYWVNLIYEDALMEETPRDEVVSAFKKDLQVYRDVLDKIEKNRGVTW